MIRFLLILFLSIGLWAPTQSLAGFGKKVIAAAILVKTAKKLKTLKKSTSATKKSTADVHVASPNTTATVSKSKYPQAAQHIEDAQSAGKPSILTINRSGAAANRRASLKNEPPTKGLDRDEYPPAMSGEGGAGASVRSISPKDNRGAGSCIGHQCRSIPDGGMVEIKVIP